MNNYKIISIQGGREAYGLVSIWVLKYESMEHWGRNWQGSVWLCWMVQYDGVFVTLKAAISHSRQCFCASSSSLISTFIFTFKEHFENWPNKPNLVGSFKMPWVKALIWQQKENFATMILRFATALIGSHCPQFLVSLENLELMTLSCHSPLLIKASNTCSCKSH